jgi:PAS domain S-box-containing protein
MPNLREPVALSGQRLREEMGLAEQAAFLNSVLESSTEYSIVAKDLQGRILAWNEGARRVYGYEPADVVGKSAFLLHDPDDVKSGRAQQFLDEALASGKWSGALTRVRKNGTRFRAFVTITLRRDAAGHPTGFTMISRDLTESERIERELRESQEYNRGLIESNIDALMTTDPLGIITDVNRQMCEMTGVEREELIGTAFKRYFTDPARAEDGIRKVLAEDRVTNYELTMRARNGRETVVSYNATTFRSTDGKLKGVFAAARDITDQKRLEEELRQTQNYTRGLIEASVDALVTVDPQFLVTDVNEQTMRITGYSREELIGSPFPDYFTDPERATVGVKQTLAEGFVTNYVLVLRSRTGKETPVSFNASVFRDTEGHLKGIFAAARDITEQKRLEEELRQAQNYTRGLIESSVDPMITVNQALTITDVNEQMVRLTEVPKEKLIGSRFDRYFTEPARAAAGVKKTLKESYVTNYELTLKTPGGREVLVSFNASIFKDTEGNVRGIFAVARDVTEQRRLESQLREQQNYARGLIEASVDALMTVNPDGVITDVNEQTVRLSGFNREQLIGSPFRDYFTDPDRARDGVKKTFADGVVTNYELVFRARSGFETVVSFNASVFKDTEGKVAGILAGARDITQQKRIEQEVREQQAYNRGLIESNIDALMTTDPLGVITDVNRQMCEVTGRTRDELIGTPFKGYFTDAQRAEDGIRKVLAEGQVTNYELTIRAKDGTETVVSYNATTFKGEDDKLRGVFAAARDITDQKRLEQQLREQQVYNRGLIESSVDAMLTVDPDFTITDVNEQMVRLSGYSREQLIGSAFQDYFTEPAQASAGVRKTLAEGFVTNYELTLRSRHRREILVSFNASVFKDTAGDIRGIFAVARDVTEQRRLEEQLRESQHYNRGLIESSVDALVTVGPDVAITDVNEQMIRLTGFTREELIGSSFMDYFTEPDRAAAGVRQTLGEGSVTNYELVLKAKTGKRTVVSFNAGTFRDTAGRVAGILAAARDITAQKRLQEQLRDQQNYNRSLIEASVDALMTVDPGGIITDVNDQTAKLMGYNRKQLVGSPFVEYLTDSERARTGVKKTFDEGVVTNYELVVRSKTGRKIPVSFNAAVFRDGGGAVQGILAAARDITQQKGIEGQLREQQTYTRSLIESNIDALMTTDPLGLITDVNRQMCEVTGRSREELIGTPFKEYFTDPQRAEDGIRKVLSEDRVTNYELTIRAKDGKETVVSYNATTFKGADGRLRGVFAAARDIAEHKVLEEQLRKKNEELEEQYRRVQEANRLKSEFLANMSHELRTPLNGIIGFAELMHDGKTGPVSTDQKEYLGDILTSSRHLLQLINDVLDLAKVESGKMEFRPEAIDLERVVAEVRDVLRTLTAHKRIRVDTEIESALGSVTADVGKLKQVLYNYLSNAIKFSPDEGHVTVRVVPENKDEFRLEVRDNGIGIKREDMSRLFVEFQQLDSSTAKKYPGTGLGLALTKRIVEAQGGRVGVESTPGKGSMFSAVFPRGGVRVAPLLEEMIAGPMGAPRVLVIEDDTNDRAWIARTLVAAGYSVDAVDTGGEALVRCGLNRYDAITLDLLLPDMNGQDLLKAIRAAGENQETPVVVVTVVAQQGIVAGFHVQDILVKPVEPGAILAALRRARVEPDRTRPILVVDDDPQALKLASRALEEAGYESDCVQSAGDGLTAAAARAPAAVVLDLVMPDTDGFGFLKRFRATPSGRRTPVIIWTVKDVTRKERDALEAAAQAIVLKSEGTAALLAEIRNLVPHPASPTPAPEPSHAR